MPITTKNILIILFVIALNLESILVMLKYKNIESSSHYYDLIFLGVAIFNKDNETFWITIIILLINIIYRHINAYYTYKIVNIASENFAEIDFIIKKCLIQGNNIDKQTSIILKGSRPKKQELKPMLNEINHYLRGNGKTSLKSTLGVVALLSVTMLCVYVGVVKI